MKTILLSLLFVSGFASAAPWDLNGQQYDQFGTSMINRLMPLPSGGASGIYIYNSSLNLPKLATVDSTLNISSGGVISVAAGTIPVNADWSCVAGLCQILNKPTVVSAFTNDAGYLVTSDLAAYATNASVTSGLVTKFNNPVGTTGEYLRGDGSLATLPSPGTGTVTSVGLTSTNLTIGGSPVTTSGTLTVALPNTGTSGTYDAVTTDALGRVTAGTNRSQSAQTRTLNSGFQISSTRASFVVYSIRIATTASIGGNQDGDVILEIASDSGFTTNVQTLSITQNAQAISLAVVLNSVQTQTGVLTGYVPAGYYTRLRTVNNTGTPAFTYRAGQEVLL